MERFDLAVVTVLAELFGGGGAQREREEQRDRCHAVRLWQASKAGDRILLRCCLGNKKTVTVSVLMMPIRCCDGVEVFFNLIILKV